jgi:hypothetical protein
MDNYSLFTQSVISSNNNECPISREDLVLDKKYNYILTLSNHRPINDEERINLKNKLKKTQGQVNYYNSIDTDTAYNLATIGKDPFTRKPIE